MLDAIEEALDQVAFAVGASVVLPGFDAVGARRDYRLRTSRFDARYQSVGIVAFVGHKAGVGQLGNEFVRTFDVGNLSGGQNHAQRLAQRIDREMQFGRQAPARAAQRLRPYFFWAPEACWWARTMVESMNTRARSRSPASAKAIRSQTPASRQRAKRT